MMFKKRRNAQDGATDQASPLPEEVPQVRPEKKDVGAMIIAAFTTIFPFVLFMLLLLFGLLWLAFGR